MDNYNIYDKIINVKLYSNNIRRDESIVGTWNTAEGIIKGHSYKDGNGATVTAVAQQYVMMYDISCKDSDMKPNIQLSLKAVAGRTVTECMLKVVGLQIPNEKLRKADLMVIEAGYNSNRSSLLTIYVDLFSAWTEKPNPDGVTCFQGICTSQALGAFFGKRKYYLRFDVEEVTIRTLLERLLHDDNVINVPAFDIEVKESFLDKTVRLKDSEGNDKEYVIGDLKITTGKTTVRASSGYQIIQWLGRELFKWGKAIGLYIYVHLFNNHVKINCSGYNKKGNKSEPVIILHHINSASFLTRMFSVKAPWVPELIPGGLFYLDAKHFSLQNTYKTLQVSDIVDSRYLYRVVTMQVDFDTCGNRNSMQLMAIPYDLASSPWDDESLSNEVNYSEATEASLNVKTSGEGIVLNDLITTVVFEDTAKREKLVREKLAEQFWMNINSISSDYKNISTTNISLDKSFVDYTDKWSHVAGPENPAIPTLVSRSFNGINWYNLWRSLLYGYIDNKKSLIQKSWGYNSTWGLLETLTTNVPYLKPSQLRTILRQAEADGYATDSLKAKLSNKVKSKGYYDAGFLNPQCLWKISLVIYYIFMYNSDGWLKYSIDLKTFGELNDSAYNYLFSKSKSKVNEDIYTIKMDGKYLQPLTIPVDSKWVKSTVTTMKDIEHSGDIWKTLYSDYLDIFKAFMDSKVFTDDDITLWYYYLKE